MGVRARVVDRRVFGDGGVQEGPQVVVVSGLGLGSGPPPPVSGSGYAMMGVIVGFFFVVVRRRVWVTDKGGRVFV
jgi:hypothetical protein